MHPYLSMLVAEQRAADMRAAAAAHRLARAARSTRGASPRRQPPAPSSTPRSGRPAAVGQGGSASARSSSAGPQPSYPASAERLGSRPVPAAIAQLSRPDDRDSELCGASGC
ncbi:MAG TPA: hypothetical protein VK836_23150 [Streptosporangiaceae bacterium]|jgi:hypothetical protein|nr:hypothetical protein [Streptosporangiaceae bacterium]